MDLQTIKAIARAKLYKKKRKNYETEEEFEKAFEDAWNTLPLIGKNKDGKSAI